MLLPIFLANSNNVIIGAGGGGQAKANGGLRGGVKNSFLIRNI